MKAKGLGIAFLAANLAACAAAPDREPEVDERTVGKIHRTDYGEVVSVTRIDVEGGKRYEGALIGATLGGVLGAVIGPGTTGSILGGLLGAAGGGLAGRQIQEELREDGYEYEIRLDDGSMVTVVELDQEPLRVGQPVRLVYGDEYVRVEPRSAATARGY